MNWVNTEVHIGEVKVRKKVTVAFKATPDIKEVTKVVASCGCTTPRFEVSSQTLFITYTAPKFPKQIVGNTQPIKKTIFVHYEDGTQDQLFIIGTKIR